MCHTGHKQQSPEGKSCSFDPSINPISTLSPDISFSDIHAKNNMRKAKTGIVTLNIGMLFKPHLIIPGLTEIYTTECTLVVNLADAECRAMIPDLFPPLRGTKNHQGAVLFPHSFISSCAIFFSTLPFNLNSLPAILSLNVL